MQEPPDIYGTGITTQGDPGDEQPDALDKLAAEEMAKDHWTEPEATSPELKLVEGGATMKSSTMDDVHAWILAALDACEVLCNHSPSREASITMTKLEEAEMWLVKLYGAEGGESA